VQLNQSAAGRPVQDVEQFDLQVGRGEADRAGRQRVIPGEAKGLDSVSRSTTRFLAASGMT